MAGDRGDLVCAASNLSKAASRCLAQPMRGHIRAVCQVTLLTEPIAEPRRGVRLAEMCDEKRLDAHRRRRVDNFAHLGMHRNFQMALFAAFRLALVNGQDAIVNMLPPKSDNITAALAGVEQ